MHLSVQCPPPSDLLQDILNYNGSSDVSSPNDDISDLTLIPPKPCLSEKTDLEEKNYYGGESILKKVSFFIFFKLN